MASISNTGKSITIAFSEAECEQFKQRDEVWQFQHADFQIEGGGTGVFTFHPDMMNGRKLGKMSNTAEPRWMLVIQSHLMPLVPLFRKVSVDVDFAQEGVFLRLPRELPMLSEAKLARANLAPAKRVRVRSKPTPAKAEPAKVITPASNVTLTIEGKIFLFDVPIMERLRLVSGLEAFAVNND